jgi:hypothetical protein
MHIYAYGSLCRGDVRPNSDADLLAVTSYYDNRLSTETFSIYSYRRLRELWEEGNPFAWHLHLESRLIFSAEGDDFLSSLEQPAAYGKCKEDCDKFALVFEEAVANLRASSSSVTFEFSNVFLGIRNAATCFSLGILHKPIFSRTAALEIGDHSLRIPDKSFKVFERARILCTRGKGPNLFPHEIDSALAQLGIIEEWFNVMKKEVSNHERIQQSS